MTKEVSVRDTGERQRRERGSGSIRQLASGRWQARFRGPDGTMRAAGLTFGDKDAADAYLEMQEARVKAGVWEPPVPKSKSDEYTGTLIKPYAQAWLDNHDVRPRTREHYQKLLDRLIFPVFGKQRLADVTPSAVRTWWRGLGETPTQRQHAYTILRAVFTQAVDDEILNRNPVHLKEAEGKKRERREAAELTPEDIAVMADAVGDRYKALILCAAWGGFRSGELRALRRRDYDPKTREVKVERGVARTKGELRIGPPKSRAGRRVVTLPLVAAEPLAEHMKQFVGKSPDALLFTSRQSDSFLSEATLWVTMQKAGKALGREGEIRAHDLRHFAGTYLGQVNTPQPDIRARMGHSTLAASEIYQHSVRGADKRAAERLDELAKAERHLRVVGDDA